MSTKAPARPEQNARRFTLCGVFRERENNRSCLLLKDAAGADRFWWLPYALDHADEIDGLDWMDDEIRKDRIRLSEDDAKIWAGRSSVTQKLATTNLRCRVGDLVEFDCPHIPESHGRSARIVGPANFNSKDWWELELLHEFVVMPDPEHPGGYCKSSKSFAPDSILVPYESERIERASLAKDLPLGDLFYLVDAHRLIYGPAMTIEHAKRRVSFYEDGEIVPAMLLAEMVAGARNISSSDKGLGRG